MLIGRLRGGAGSDGLARRAAWTVGDQALSSLSNAALSLVVAVHVSRTDFGAFALAFSLYGFAVAMTQAVAGQVLSIQYASASREEHTRASKSAVGATLAVALIASTTLLLASVFLARPLDHVLLAFAVLLPGLLVQDTWRSVFISRGTPQQAFWNDAAWLALQALSIGALLIFSIDSVIYYVIAWGASACAAAMLVILGTGSWPRVRGWKAWLIDHRQVTLPSAAGAFAIIGAVQLSFIAVATIGTLSDVGALRGSQTLLGPVNIITFGVTALAIPEVAKRQLSGKGLLLVGAAISGVLVLANLTWGGIFLLMPDSIGQTILGATWDQTRAVLPWMVVSACLIASTSGFTAMIRAWNWSSYAFRISAVAGPAILLFAALGTYIAGSVGAAIGYASASALALPLNWYYFRRVLRHGRH